jgi:hypothetical protein
MKKILSCLAAAMVLASSAASAADLPYESDPGGNGGGGSGDTPADVELSNRTDVDLSNHAGRDLPYENGGSDDPDDDPGVSWTNEIQRILALIGFPR